MNPSSDQPHNPESLCDPGAEHAGISRKTGPARAVLVAMLIFLFLAYFASYGVLRTTGYLTRGENVDYGVTMFTPDAFYGDGEIGSLRSWSDSGTVVSPRSRSGVLLRLYSPLIELEVRARWRSGWHPTR
jgi:hypothetical protein